MKRKRQPAVSVETSRDTIRRVTPLAAAFEDALRRRGVPEETLSKAFKIQFVEPAWTSTKMR